MCESKDHMNKGCGCANDAASGKMKDACERGKEAVKDMAESVSDKAKSMMDKDKNS